MSYQAVSKWENAQSCPDITLLPQICEVFAVTLDELFGIAPRSGEEHAAEGQSLPWRDDGVIRAVVYKGTRMIESCEELSNYTLVLEGNAEDVFTQMNLTVNGDVNGDANAGGSLTVKGKDNEGGQISGDATAGANIVCGIVKGDVKAEGKVSCGHVEGDVRANGNVSCGKIDGDIMSIGCKAVDRNKD